jgi:hypothetical protein
VNNWREELVETIKSKAEREAEEEERKQKRIAEALEVAEQAMAQSLEALRFAAAELGAKSLSPELGEQQDHYRFDLFEHSIHVELARSTAVLEVRYDEGRPRQFDFATDRHLAPKDAEEYVGRRLVELARASQKEHPW